MYFKDWYRITLNGGANPNGVVLRDLKYPWPTRNVKHKTLFDFCSQVVETGEVEADLSCETASWVSFGWLKQDMIEADYGGEVGDDLCYACEEWLTYWDESTQEFKFPDKKDYEHLWETPCEL